MPSYASPSQLRRLLNAVMAVAYDLDITTLLQTVVEAAREMVGARYAAIGVLDPTGTFLTDFITVGLDGDQLARMGELPKGHGILGLLISDPEPIRLPDLTEHPASFGFPVGHPPMTSFLGVPLYVRGEAFGNLYLTDKDGGEGFSDIDEELALGLASAASLAIENTRLQERAAELDVIADRERIARDLHDTVVQQLFATGLAMQLTSRRAEDFNIADRLDQHIDDIDQTIREIRTVIFGFGHPRHPGLKLRREILDLVEGSKRSLGFVPNVLLDGPIDSTVPDDIASELLPVLREALSNIARHAAASHVDVRVVADNNLSLDVIDDGRGFVQPGIGNGLDNMKHRATALGGHAEIGPDPGGGTVLHWVVPLAG